MKPSQQIAEEMAKQCASKFLDSNLLIRESVMDQIPLTQLIEVARAANRVELTDCECTCGTDPEGSCRYCGYFIRLGKALQSLKQTGKAEWL